MDDVSFETPVGKLLVLLGNNFLWPLIATNSVTSRPLTVGLQIFSSTDQGVDWSIITAATLMTSAPLLVAPYRNRVVGRGLVPRRGRCPSRAILGQGDGD